MQHSACQRLWILSLTFALVSNLGLGRLRGQDQPANAGQPANQAVQNPTKDRVIYVPYRSLKSVFSQEGATAFLPYGEYLKLLDTVLVSSLRKPSQAPVSGVIKSSQYVGRIEGDIAKITATLAVESLAEGWAEVPVRFGEAAIGEITSDSGQVLLRGTGAGNYSLLLPKTGAHTITLQLAARVRVSPEGRSVELEVPPVGITSLEFTVPEADQVIELTPKLVTEPVPSAEKSTTIKASVGSTDKISARWHAKTGSKPEMQLLANVTGATLISVEDGLLHTDAWLQYEVLRGQMEKIRLAIPKGKRVLDVTADAKIKEWSTADEAERQIVTVEFLSRLTGKTTVEVHLESDLPADGFDVAGLTGETAHGVHALDVVRESGQIAVLPSSDLSLTVELQQAVQRLAEGDVDSRIRRPGALYFKYYSPNLRLRLQAKPVEPRLMTKHVAHIVIAEDRLRTSDFFPFQIDRAGVFELKFKVPEGLSIEAVNCDRMKQFDLSADKQTLTLSLREKTLGELGVQIVAVKNAQFAKLAEEQLLPTIEPLGVELETGQILIYASEAIDVITDAAKIVAAQPDPNPPAASFPNARLVSAWTFNRRPVEISTRLARKPTRLTAHVGTALDVKQGQVQAKTQLSYLVEYAGLDTFRFSVPAAIADAIQISASPNGPQIKQKSRAAEAVEGWVAWTVVMQRDITGTQDFTVTYDLTPGVDDATKAEKSTVELVRVLDPFPDAAAAGSRQLVSVSRVTGEVTVTKDRAQAVVATASGGDIEPIDVRELTRLPRDGFTAFRYFQQGAKLDLSAQKFDVQSVVDVVVSRALVEAVIDRTGSATFRARYVLKTSERQRLPIALRKGVEILGVSVDRKPVSPEKNTEATADTMYDSYFVNIARTKSAEESFAVAVMYRLKLEPKPFAHRSGELDLWLPKFEGTSQAKNSVIQQLRVAVWVPEDHALVGSPKNFTLESRPRLNAFFLGQRSFGRADDLEQWIGTEAGGIFDFPTEGRRHVYSSLGGHSLMKLYWWNLPFFTWIVSGALVIAALVLRHTGCENKLTILFLAVFAAAAYALSDQDLVLHGLAVASYGLVIGAGLWIVSGLTQQKSLRPLVHLNADPPPTLPPDTTTTTAGG